MAKDDYSVIVFKILSYLYGCFKKGEPVNRKLLSPKEIKDMQKELIRIGEERRKLAYS